MTGLEREALKTRDAILSTLERLDSHRLNDSILSLIETLMRQSYMLGMIKETHDQLLFKALFEEEEEEENDSDKSGSNCSM